MTHQNAVRGAVFGADSRRVLTWSEDGTARVWEPATGEPLTPPLEHEDVVWGAAFSADGRRVLTWSADGTARVWDIGIDAD